MSQSRFIAYPRRQEVASEKHIDNIGFFSFTRLNLRTLTTAQLHLNPAVAQH